MTPVHIEFMKRCAIFVVIFDIYDKRYIYFNLVSVHTHRANMMHVSRW